MLARRQQQVDAPGSDSNCQGILDRCPTWEDEGNYRAFLGSSNQGHMKSSSPYKVLGQQTSEVEKMLIESNMQKMHSAKIAPCFLSGKELP